MIGKAVDNFLRVFTPAMCGYLVGYQHANYRCYKFLKDYK